LLNWSLSVQRTTAITSHQFAELMLAPFFEITFDWLVESGREVVARDVT